MSIFFKRKLVRVFVFLKTLFNLALRLSRINLSEISLSYQKSRWLKKSISFDLYCVAAMIVAICDIHYSTKGFSNTSELSVPIYY